ncbi:MAG: thiamine phosphate synthase [Rikenellaceae bacterium]
MRPKFDLSLYLVTDSTLAGRRSLEEIVREAVAGGVTIVQLREKELPTGEFIERARRLKSLLAPYSVPLIINDRVDVALAADADGVHIGQSDMSYKDARAILGKDKIIGLSVESLEEVEQANRVDVDYIGISPLHSTPTKTDTAQPFGIEGCTKAVDLSIHPSVAIGGINISNVAQTMACGVDGVAVVSAIICADNPRESSDELLTIVNNNRPRWSTLVRRASNNLYNSIIAQPFNVDMMSGELTKERFRRYIEQDTIYIINYSQEMLIVADMLPTTIHKELFRKFAIEGMEAEKSLHALLVEQLGGVSAVESSRTTQHYMNHTRQWVDRGDLELSMAAILPCIWIYSLVGRHLFANSNLEENPYRDWIETYASEMMMEGVNLSIELVDNLAANSTQSRRAMMRQEFLKAVWYEWAFWEYAYNGVDVEQISSEKQQN